MSILENDTRDVVLKNIFGDQSVSYLDLFLPSVATGSFRFIQSLFPVFCLLYLPALVFWLLQFYPVSLPLSPASGVWHAVFLIYFCRVLPFVLRILSEAYCSLLSPHSSLVLSHVFFCMRLCPVFCHRLSLAFSSILFPLSNLLLFPVPSWLLPFLVSVKIFCLLSFTSRCLLFFLVICISRLLLPSVSYYFYFSVFIGVPCLLYLAFFHSTFWLLFLVFLYILCQLVFSICRLRPAFYLLPLSLTPLLSFVFPRFPYF